MKVRARPILAVVALIVVAGVVYGAMHLFGSSGQQFAKDQLSVVSSADAARDAAAKVALASVLQTARLAFVDGGESYANAGPGQLSALDPSYTYTDGPSTAPTVVSVATTPGTWSAAVMSSSGTCFWVHDDPAKGGTFYGSGATCTGQAAAGASGGSW